MSMHLFLYHSPLVWWPFSSLGPSITIDEARLEGLRAHTLGVL